MSSKLSRNRKLGKLDLATKALIEEIILKNYLYIIKNIYIYKYFAYIKILLYLLNLLTYRVYRAPRRTRLKFDEEV